MRRGFTIGIFFIGFFFVLDHGLTEAADVELILGTSSGFKIVRGTSVSAGISTFFVGSSTVSIGTTTQAAMLTIAGSSTSASEISLSVKNSSGADSLHVRNDGAILIGTNTSNLNSALYVGSATSGGLGTITAGFLSVGTISANASLHSGTTTVRFLGEIYAGTITAASGSKFVGDGSGLSGVTSSGLSVTAFSGYTGNITTSGTLNAGSTTVSTFTTTGSITAGSEGSFKVDIAGSMTATTITSTGSVTASSLIAAGTITTTGRVGIGTTTPGSLYLLQVTNDSDTGVVFGSNGSMTAKTITSTGSITVRSGSAYGTITAGFLSVGTITAETAIHGTTTVGFLGGAKFADTVYFEETNNGNSGASKNIDWSASNKQRLTITENVTLTFTNPGGPSNLLLVLVQGNPGTGTVTWPASVKWPGGTAITVSTATSSVDIVSCYFDGTNYNCVGSLDFR